MSTQPNKDSLLLLHTKAIAILVALAQDGRTGWRCEACKENAQVVVVAGPPGEQTLMCAMCQRIERWA